MGRMGCVWVVCVWGGWCVFEEDGVCGEGGVCVWGVCVGCVGRRVVCVRRVGCVGRMGCVCGVCVGRVVCV